MSFTSDKKELRRILNSHKIGECTTEEETAFITVFFRLYHPDWYNKTQGLMQVVTYKIKAETKHRSDGRCFWLILENGAEEDIGFRILNAHPADKEQYMRKNIAEPTLKSKACLKCLYFTIIIFDLCRYLEYFSYLYTINQTE